MALKQTTVRLFGFTLFVVLSFAFSLHFTQTAFADYTVPTGQKCENGSNPSVNIPAGSSTPVLTCADNTRSNSSAPVQAGADDATKTEDEESDGTTCAVEGIGWILCPITQGAAKMADFTFQFLANNFLAVEPELLDPDSGTKAAWEGARNIANVMFIIAFIIVIYSQITGAGLSNYGIKRMLPRLIIAAILVNISFYICQAMVDISNIIGYNLNSAMTNEAKKIGVSVLGSSGAIDNETSGGILAAIATGALAVAGLVWVIIAPMGAIILMVLITVITIILILLLRKAFIVLLVVVSPVAFVAYLLPNTEKYFSKWLNMFWQLLLVFPIVGMLLGSGQLASAIILNAGVEQSSNQQAAECDSANPDNQKVINGGYGVPCEGTVDVGEGKQAGWTLGLVATGIAIAPLLAVWAVLRGALAAAGAIGGKISGAVQKGSAGGGNGAAAWAGKNTAIGRGLATRKAIKANYGNEKFNRRMASRGGRGKLTRTMARGVGGNLGVGAEALGQTELGKRVHIDNMTGGIRAQNSKLTSSFAGAADKLDNEEIGNRMAALKRSANPIDEAQKALNDAILANDALGAKAAQNVLMTSGGPGMDTFMTKMASVEDKANKELVNALKQNALQNHGGTMKEKGGVVAGWAGSSHGTMAGIATGQDTVADSQGNLSQKATNPFKGLSDSQIAKQTSTSITNAKNRGFISPETAHRILNNTSAAEDLGGAQREVLQDLARNYTPPTPPPGPTPPPSTP